MAEYLMRDDVLSNADIITVQTREYGTIDVVPVEYLAVLPTVQVEEVKHGTWVKEKEYEDGKIDYKCSVCDYDDTFTETTIVFHKYCNYCGAKMDGTPKERGGEK